MNRPLSQTFGRIFRDCRGPMQPGMEKFADTKEQSLIMYLNCEASPPYPLYVFIFYFHFFISLILHPVAHIPLLMKWPFSLALVRPAP
jgi:hypothetical protein